MTGQHVTETLSVTLPPEVLARHLRALELRGFSPNTIYGRQRALARLGAVLPVPVLDATAADLAAWREAMNLTPSSVRWYVSSVYQFYVWVVEQGIRDDNPAARLPVPKAPRRLPRPIGEEALMDALASAPPRIRLWLVLAGWCGLRACEIAGLRRESVMETLTPPVLIVAENATKGRGERVLPLPDFVVAELAAFGLPARSYVFPRADGGRGPNRPWTISHLASEHLHRCGYSDTLHSLRHRYISAAYKASHDLRLCQELAGHRSPETTAGYAAYDNGAAADAVNALPVPAAARRRHLRAVPPAP
jgi:integrase